MMASVATVASSSPSSSPPPPPPPSSSYVHARMVSADAYACTHAAFQEQPQHAQTSELNNTVSRKERCRCLTPRRSGACRAHNTIINNNKNNNTNYKKQQQQQQQQQQHHQQQQHYHRLVNSTTTTPNNKQQTNNKHQLRRVLPALPPHRGRRVPRVRGSGHAGGQRGAGGLRRQPQQRVRSTVLLLFVRKKVRPCPSVRARVWWWYS